MTAESSAHIRGWITPRLEQVWQGSMNVEEWRQAIVGALPDTPSDAALSDAVSVHVHREQPAGQGPTDTAQPPSA